jgi:hypothetical protein
VVMDAFGGSKRILVTEVIIVRILEDQ